jgi:type IV pilus assembly protein PilQ
MSLMHNANTLDQRDSRRASTRTRVARLALTAAVVLVPVLASGAYSAQQDGQQAAPPSTQPTRGQEAPPSTRPADQTLMTEAQQPQDQVDPFAPDTAVPAPSAVDAGEPTVSFDATAETVEINVSDANLVDVLRMLSVQSRKNIIASKDVNGIVTCNLFDVTVDEALDAILRSNGYVAREEGNFIYVYTQEEAQRLDEQNRRQETRVFRLYHISPELAATSIQPALSGSDGATVSVTEEADIGVGSSREEAGGFSYSNGDMIIVRDYPEHLDQVARILAEIDHRPEQVLIEATILSTKLTESNAFGVDFNVVGGVDFSSFTSNAGQITSADVGDTGSNPIHSAGTGDSFTAPIAGGLKLGFVSNNVSAFVAALEGVTDTTVLANPKVLALNKQRGEVLVGREDGYLTTTLTETTATQSVEFLQTGTRLIFRPFISRDGYVRLEIHPEDSTGGLNASNLPFKSTTEVTSNVMVKDGHTIVIGGLFREQAQTTRSQIPILGNLPIIGAAFRRQADVTDREEIIILLTPHIVKDYGKYAQLSEQELKRAEKLRVGMRKGMMPTGRERMSQMYYEKAVRELARNRPNRGRANHYLNAALNLNPKFIEAIELKEKLSRRVVVEADQSTIRSFVRRSVLNDVRDGAEDVPELRPDRDPVVPEPQDVLPVSADNPTTRPADATTRPATRPATQPAKGQQWVDVKD